MLYKLDRYEEAIPALDQVYQRFAHSDDDKLYEHASDALVKKMDAAEKLQIQDELEPIYSEVIDRLKDSEKEKYLHYVDHAYINCANIFLAKNQNDKALEALDQVIKRLGNAQRNHGDLAKAMYIRAELLELLGSDQEALAAIEEFLDMFG